MPRDRNPSEPQALGAPPLALELSPQQELAICLRLLAAEGYSENFAGHITWQPPGQQAMWCNPAGLWWDEVTASDMCLVDLDGKVVWGRWPVTEAIFIHTELHRRRPDARVVVHGHPYYATLLSAIPAAPVIGHQAPCVFDGEVGVVNEYDGAVNNVDAGQHLADGVGAATGVILANHGALVIGDHVPMATFRAVTFERMCRMSVDLRKMNATAQDILPQFRKHNYEWLKTKGTSQYWAGAVRMLLKDRPEVLN
jgi:ribulose-5-phosphate 4-epimerase/fuculose-1-phosphate aldolase